LQQVWNTEDGLTVSPFAEFAQNGANTCRVRNAEFSTSLVEIAA
jgi:hypothetical protein